jgi:S-layer protein
VWFQSAGDTYVVEDNSSTATFQNGVDTLVKLSGLVDLSTATFNAVNGSLAV